MVFRLFALSFTFVTITLTSATMWSDDARAAGTLIWGMPAETDTLDLGNVDGWLEHPYQITYQIFEARLVKEDLTRRRMT